MTDGSLRVLFDGFWWAGGPIANRVVQREIIAAWATLWPQDEVFVTVRRAHEDSVSDLPDGVTPVRTRLTPHAVSNMTELGWHAVRLGVDWVVAHNFSPLTWRRTATFVHDVMFRDHPEWFSLKERAYFSLMLPTARRAAVLSTSSRTEADRMERELGGTRRVVTTGLSVATGLRSAVPVAPDGVVDLDGFALCVGRLNARKNLGAVVRGAACSSRITARSPLLIVGSAEYSGRDAELPDEVRDLVRSGAVRFLGRVDDAELAWLYGHASLTVFLSRDEGFGLPALEAASFGSPLLLSDIPVFREVGSTVATFVPPDAPARQVAAAMDAAWAVAPSTAARADLVGRYSWESAARALRTAMSPADRSRPRVGTRVRG